MPTIGTITTSSRTASSVVLNGSGFETPFSECPPIAVTIYDAQNNVLQASYLQGGGVLTGYSWQITLTGITDAGFFGTYSIDAEDNPGCYQLGFYIAPFAVPENNVIKKIKKTIFSKITRGLSYNPIQSQRKKFPTI
jgi:hypothetical protein